MSKKWIFSTLDGAVRSANISIAGLENSIIDRGKHLTSKRYVIISNDHIFDDRQSAVKYRSEQGIKQGDLVGGSYRESYRLGFKYQSFVGCVVSETPVWASVLVGNKVIKVKKAKCVVISSSQQEA